MVNDLLTFGDGLDINERSCAKENEPLAREGETPIAIARGKQILRPEDDGALPLQLGDRVIFIQTHGDTAEEGEAELARDDEQQTPA